MLLKVGRHIRPEKNYKIIIAREEGEAKYLQGYKKQYDSLKTISHSGALALIDGTPNQEQLNLAATIVARYSKGRNELSVDLLYQKKSGEQTKMSVKPAEPEEILKKWLL